MLHPAQRCVCIYLKDAELEGKFNSNIYLQVRLGMNFIPNCQISSQTTQSTVSLYAVIHQAEIWYNTTNENVSTLYRAP